MRTWIFTCTFVVVLTALTVTGELSLKENREVMRAYERFSSAVDAVLDDACEYLGIIPYDVDGVRQTGAEYVESIFIEAMAAALGEDVDELCRGRLSGMIAVFAISDGKGSMTMRSGGKDGAWKTVSDCGDSDKAAAAVTEAVMDNYGRQNGSGPVLGHMPKDLRNGIILPDSTGLTEYKAGEGPSVLVCMVCRRGRGITGDKEFVCVRNARLRENPNYRKQ